MLSFLKQFPQKIRVKPSFHTPKAKNGFVFLQRYEFSQLSVRFFFSKKDPFCCSCKPGFMVLKLLLMSLVKFPWKKVCGSRISFVKKVLFLWLLVKFSPRFVYCYCNLNFIVIPTEEWQLSKTLILLLFKRMAIITWNEKKQSFLVQNF
jgi:hypothetical protein